jgi:hypothetical protein
VVYFPEVMWSIFYSIIGNNDRDLNECHQMKAILRKAKNKYKGLDRGISLDSLCGNRFWKNEITVTKYLCGMTILQSIRALHEKKANELGSSTTRRKHDAQMEALQKDPPYFKKLFMSAKKKNTDTLEQFERMKSPIKQTRP